MGTVVIFFNVHILEFSMPNDGCGSWLRVVNKIARWFLKEILNSVKLTVPNRGRLEIA